MNIRTETRAEIIFNQKYSLDDGAYSEVQIARYERGATTPRLVVFEEPTNLLEWCKEQEIDHAINGGFTMFHREQRPTRLLGTYRYNGRFLASLPFATPRSGLHFSADSDLSIIHKDTVALPLEGDYFQAGPMLIKSGKILVDDDYDFEGVALPPLQMDDDWTRNRFPRSAIGLSEDAIFTVTCNGYSPAHESGDSGLSLRELSVLMANIGIKDALNLDGGSKATHIIGGEIINTPRGGYADSFQFFSEGLPLLSAIIFETS